MNNTNGSFPSVPLFHNDFVPLFQNESKCETFLMKMTLICMKMKVQAKLICDYSKTDIT